MPRAPRAARRRVRPWVERLVLLLAAMLVGRTWCVEGLMGSCPVASGSMAETLLGVHREVTCDDCGYRFACDAEQRPVAARAVCPNCGFAGNDLESSPDLAGDRLLIDKAVFQFRRPRRWEVIAMHHPGQASQVDVKRVVGLPGESIQILHGDVYANGKIVRKTLTQQRALALPVHDANHQPTIEPVPPSRWQGSDDGRWIFDAGRLLHPRQSGQSPAADKPSGIDWLEYVHWRRLPGSPGQVRDGPVTDLCGYNQTRPRREEDVHPTGDLLLSLRLAETSGQGRLAVRATDGRETFEVRIDLPQGRYEVLRDGRAMPGAAGQLTAIGDGCLFEVSLVDRQFLLAFDGRTAVTAPLDPSLPPPAPNCRPLAIGAQGGLAVEVRDLSVYRDVYYTHPIGPSGRWGLDEPVHLEADQYFLLGDNSPISEDSRTWPEGPAVDAKLLVGKPLVVHWPAGLLGIGPWRFQVPNPAKIRYIR